MRNRLEYRRAPIWTPIAQLVAALTGVVVFIGALFLGLVVLSVVVGLAILVFAAISIRMWWLRRRLGRTGRRGAGHGSTIEGEFIVLEKRSRRGD